MSSHLPEDMLDLLVSGATEGLEGPERDRLAGAADRDPHVQSLQEGLELTAAVTHLALLDAIPGARTRMPAGLRERMLAAAREAQGDAARLERLLTRDDAGSTASVSVSTAAGGRRSAGGFGWAVAAAVALAWSGTVLVERFGADFPLIDQLTGGGSASGPVADAGRSPDAERGLDGPPASADPTPAARRQALLAEATDAVTLPWAQKVDGYERVSGDVVWSNARQEGYLRLAAMPPNDAAVSQYQLWIVDPARDEEPVDGGVFDVPATAATDEVVVPIDAKLRVLDPAAFAITREKPGGVVVSEGPLLLVAAL